MLLYLAGCFRISVTCVFLLELKAVQTVETLQISRSTKRLTKPSNLQTFFLFLRSNKSSEEESTQINLRLLRVLLEPALFLLAGPESPGLPPEKPPTSTRRGAVCRNRVIQRSHKGPGIREYRGKERFSPSTRPS